MTLFDRIEDLRAKNGISQGKLEKELGFSNGSISKWRNSLPNPTRLQKLAEYFDVSVEFLMTGKDPSSEFLYSNENADFLVAVQKQASNNMEFVDNLEKYMKLSESNRKSVDDLIDFLFDKEKKETD